MNANGNRNVPYLNNWNAKLLRIMKKLGAADEVKKITDDLIATYPNRPAMLEELHKVRL